MPWYFTKKISETSVPSISDFPEKNRHHLNSHSFHVLTSAPQSKKDIDKKLNGENNEVLQINILRKTASY